MSHSSTIRCEDLRKHIRTLTSLLQRFNLQKPPSKQPRDILPFLNHFTTLLTCGDPYDVEAKKVIAVTGSIDSFNGVKILVVAQNPYRDSPVEGINMELIKKDTRSLEEVINGPFDTSLIQHIADVWVALSEFCNLNPGAPGYLRQMGSLEVFLLSRSFRKFTVRFNEHTRLCGGRKLYDVIREWRPSRAEIAAKWVSPRGWLLNYQGFPQINSRRTDQGIEWEFSDKTKVAWSEILAIILREMDVGISQVNSPLSESEEEQCQVMEDLNNWCRALYNFVVWDAGIVKSLLTETTMVDSITMTAKGNICPNETEDENAELRQEPDESKGQQVLRYLKTVIAWHAAVHHLPKDSTLPELLKKLEIGLVEASGSSSSILTVPEIVNALPAEFKNLSAEHYEKVVGALIDHYPNTGFTGCVHAEATLMGLVNYYAHRLTYINQHAFIGNEENMWKIIQPIADAGNAVIAVDKKCCWCCDWLGHNLESQFKLPGTHGIMYAWDPPILGIGESVLEKFEDVLWKELYKTVTTLVIKPSYSRHSSGSPEEMAMDDLFSDFMVKSFEH